MGNQISSEGSRNKRPISKYKSGSIQAAIFKNEREHNGVVMGFKTISLSRSYKKKGEDVWRNEVIHLRRNDLPRVILVLQKAHEELLLTDMKDEEN